MVFYHSEHFEVIFIPGCQAMVGQKSL